MSIGSKILELRTAKRLSQGELSDLLDVSRQSVSKWETDSAVPDLDKLMKLCDVFGVTLDELTERTVTGHTENSAVEVHSDVSLTQRVMGYILFALSLLGGLLLLFRGTNPGDFIIMVPISLSLFICSMICLFLKKRALYWCIWAALAPLTILTPHVASFTTLYALWGTQLCCVVGMAVVAALFFRKTYVSVSRKGSLTLIAAWIAVILLYAWDYSILSCSWLISFIANFALFVLVAGLETYTVCYLQSVRH